MPPTPRLSAPLSNVRFPPGAPHNVHRLRVQSVAHGEERSPPGQPKRSRTFTKVASAKTQTISPNVPLVQRLTVRDERSGFTRFVTLKDEWVDLEIAPDDFVNVIGDFDAQGNCTVGTPLALCGLVNVCRRLADVSFVNGVLKFALTPQTATTTL